MLDQQGIDVMVVVIANLVNLLMTGIFVSRPKGWERVEYVLGVSQIMFVLPLGYAIIVNALRGREWWFVVLPALLVFFLLVELWLDYIRKLDFRNTALLGPYLLLYYVALMAMIGYSFMVAKPYGFITLTTYFLQLLATWYSYTRVGHGRRGKET